MRESLTGREENYALESGVYGSSKQTQIIYREEQGRFFFQCDKSWLHACTVRGCMCTVSKDVYAAQVRSTYHCHSLGRKGTSILAIEVCKLTIGPHLEERYRPL